MIYQRQTKVEWSSGKLYKMDGQDIKTVEQLLTCKRLLSKLSARWQYKKQVLHLTKLFLSVNS